MRKVKETSSEWNKKLKQIKDKTKIWLMMFWRCCNSAIMENQTEPNGQIKLSYKWCCMKI